VRTAARAAALAVAAMLAVGCGSDDDGESASTTTTPVDAGATTTTVAVDDATTTTSTDGGGDQGTDPELPETPLRAALETTYPTEGFDAEAFGLEPGDVTAAWYAVGDRWAVHYDGLTREAASGKCPGNSIRTATAFEHISNSPFGALACTGYEDQPDYQGTILPPGSLFVCGEDTVVYVTEIPLDATGVLFGSLEQVLDTGVIQGMTSTVEADADAAPEIEVADCTVIS
jgi:hypothetical protein